MRPGVFLTVSLLIFVCQAFFRFLHRFAVLCQIAFDESVLNFRVAADYGIFDFGVPAYDGVLDFSESVRDLFGNFFVCFNEL